MENLLRRSCSFFLANNNFSAARAISLQVVRPFCAKGRAEPKKKTQEKEDGVESESPERRSEEEVQGMGALSETEAELRRKRKEKERRKGVTSSSLLHPKTPQEEEREKKRFEIDVPPVEEVRHKRWKSRPTRSVNKALMRTDLFEKMNDKNKQSFGTACEVFVERDAHLRGHVEFIYAALQQMIKFGVHRDLDSYKKLIDIFPKGRMIATNMFQVEFMHYPKQQQCGIDILEQMENYGVIPDTEVQQMLTNIFGSQSFPMRKAGRMTYWMPKFKHLSPWVLPDPLPDDTLELAKLAIQRITSIDLSTTVTVFDASELDDAVDLTWIVSGQSQEQRNLIESHPKGTPLYVEGAFRVWLARTCINYFVLRGEPRKRPGPPGPLDKDDVSKLHTIFKEDYKSWQVDTVPSVHEQEDGVILSVCATATSSRDSVLSWIRFLEKDNPRLGKDIPVLFTLTSPIGPTDDLEVPSLQDAEQQKLLQSSPPTFSVSSGGKLGPDPRWPNLKSMGIWTESESVFPNWPHFHHEEGSKSWVNLQENLEVLKELEDNLISKKQEAEKTKGISEDSNPNANANKRIE